MSGIYEDYYVGCSGIRLGSTYVPKIYNDPIKFEKEEQFEYNPPSFLDNFKEWEDGINQRLEDTYKPNFFERILVKMGLANYGNTNA